MIDPQKITQAQRALGRLLADYRRAADLTQEQLGPLVQYGRSTVANVEIGRQTCRRTFWERADRALAAGGALIRAYDDVKALERRQREEIARRMDPTLASGPPADPEHPADVTLTMDATDATLRLRVDGRELVVQLDRRRLLSGGLGTLLELALDYDPHTQADRLRDFPAGTLATPGPGPAMTITSPKQLAEIVAHLHEQWHALVRTDNLLGPRYALAGVRTQITIIEALLLTLQDSARDDVVRLAARYAESAAWLYEDSGDLDRTRHWLSRAMDWAYEADDRTMLAWITYRRAGLAAEAGQAGQAVALARAARRDEDHLPAPMRAALRVQEAHGRAGVGEESVAHRLLDDAHQWATKDTAGDARDGHGSFCTPGYIELRRADCWLLLHRPATAITIYEQALPHLPEVYQRDRAAGLARLAHAHTHAGQPEQAATAASAALPIARSTGSGRILRELHRVGSALQPHRTLAPVGALIADLHEHRDT